MSPDVSIGAHGNPRRHDAAHRMTAAGTLLRRAQPWLGTLVSIEVAGEAAADAVDRGFGTVARIHALMSFHEPASEVSRLNREAARQPVTVSAETRAVLQLAREIAEATDGRFDVTVAPRLVEWGLLPAPAGAPPPDPRADWRDVELLEDSRVRFRRPLWLDLGGIAKGWAVDAALAAMALPPQAGVVVNAGGDLRVAGPGPHRVLLRVPGHPDADVPALELAAAAVASSTGAEARRRFDGSWVGPHVDGRSRRAARTDVFASVVADRCAVADALTKVALDCSDEAHGALDAALRRFGATAYRYDPDVGWSRLGIDA